MLRYVSKSIWKAYSQRVNAKPSNVIGGDKHTYYVSDGTMSDDYQLVFAFNIVMKPTTVKIRNVSSREGISEISLDIGTEKKHLRHYVRI